MTIGNSVANIEAFAFGYCSNLKYVNIYDLAAWCKISFANSSPPSNPLLYAHHLYLNGMEVKDLVIPNTVTSISNLAFSGCSELTSVTIPNSVTSIGYYAFGGCSGLTSVTIGNSVTSIDWQAFQGCSGLTSINIPNSVTNLGGYVFADCYNMNSATIGSSVTNILEHSFSGCKKLKSLTIGQSVTSIGWEAFKDCPLIENVYIPITDNSAYCNNRIVGFLKDLYLLGILHLLDEEGNEIKEYRIPDDVTSISPYAFNNCSNLTRLTIGKSVTSIGNYAFSGCSNLISVTFHCKTVNNSYSGFNNIKNIREIIFGSEVEEIFLSTFNGCSGIQSMSIGAGVRIINSGLYHSPAKVIWLTNTPPNGYQVVSGLINYVANDQYTKLNNKKVYPFLSSLFESGNIKYVPVSPSERTCDAIDCVYNDSVTSLCLSNKVMYKGVEMTLQEMGPYLFCNNSFLENIELALKDTLQRVISAHAFEGCANIEKLVIPKNITDIGENAMSGCAKVSSIEIPPSVKSIGNNAFEYCVGLKEFLIADRNEVLTLGYNYYKQYQNTPLFANCPLDSVYIGGNISYYKSDNSGYSPFYRNTSLRTVVITDKETEISENEFYGCTNLQDVKIGDGVESFGDWAFSGCSSLKNFSFGMSVETIGKEAFSDCTAMERIYSRSPQPPVCGTQALDDINKWECVLTVPAGNKAAYQAADQWKEFFFIEEGEAVNKYINITIEKSEGGKVLVNGKETPEQIKKGNDVELQFIPDEGYSLKQVLVNSDDVTAKIADGKYTVTSANVDLTVMVTFGVNQYTLTYLVDGEEYKTLQVDYKATITPEPDPVKEGYTFSGWSEIPETMPAHDVTVNGTFSVNSYTLTYLIDDEVYKTMEVVYGSTITPEAAPTKEGYTFSGWKGLPETMPAKMVIVTGAFSINSYTLTYMIDEEVYKQVVYEYGATITPEPQPEGDYVSFEWVGVPEKMPAHDVTVTAVYETGIAEIMMMAQQGQVRIYSPNGKKLSKLQKGLNIVVLQDGTTKKVVVK